MNTERRGINRRLHGAFRALTEQAKYPNYSPAEAKSDMKWLATSEGYPMKKKRVKFRGKVIEWIEPESMAGQTDHNALIVMQTVQVLADEKGLYLYEYDENEKPFRSVGGRTFAEMTVYIAELRAEGREEEARRLEQRPRWKKEIDIF